MSVALATQNPEAAARIGQPKLMPGIGSPVVYFGRQSEMYMGSRELAAIVLRRDIANDELTLLITRAADDQFEQDRVPRQQGDERGWKWVEQPVPPVAQDYRGPGVPLDQHDKAQLDAVRTELSQHLVRFENFMNELSAVFFGNQEKPEVALLDQFAAIRVDVAKLGERVKAIEGKKAKPKG